MIYLDNNATTMVAPEVVKAIVPYLEANYYNPSSMYESARVTALALSDARSQIADFLGGVAPSEILFTSCATESNNAAILGVMSANPDRRHIITSSVEHPAVFEVCKDLQRQGYEVTFLPVDQSGLIAVSDFVQVLRPDTALVTLMHANNETGVIFPVAEFARIAKETDPGIIIHTDATQSTGKLPIDLTHEFANVDLLSFSGHKLHAPKGIGTLFVRRGSRWRPYLIGGHQEKGRRAGTENVAYIVGLAKAVELAAKHQATEVTQLAALRDKLEREIEARISYVQINGKGSPRLPNTLNVACHFIEGEGILYKLDSHGICASSGSACTSGSLEPSHVLRAMHVPFTAVHGSVRFSLSRYNTEEEIDKVIELFPGIVAGLRKLSPYWDSAGNRPRPEAEKMLTDPNSEFAR